MGRLDLRRGIIGVVGQHPVPPSLRYTPFLFGPNFEDLFGTSQGSVGDLFGLGRLFDVCFWCPSAAGNQYVAEELFSVFDRARGLVLIHC